MTISEVAASRGAGGWSADSDPEGHEGNTASLYSDSVNLIERDERFVLGVELALG